MPNGKLEVGETTRLEVQARARRTSTSLVVAAGEQYEVSATGTWCDTEQHCCTADGYESTNAILRTSERWRRVPKARWFVLIAATREDEKRGVAVGSRGLYEPAASGTLVFFANDVSFMYFNNSGSVSVSVRRRR
jgi:hypothetical protein